MNYYDHKEMRYQLSTYVHHLYRRCRIDFFLAERIQHIRGLPPLQNINLGEGRARNTDPYNIQTGQVVQFVSYNWTLDAIMFCGLYTL